MERDATRAMGGRPVLFVSYSGVLGGAERVLLDCATRIGRPAVIACPDGPLARAATVPVEILRRRPPQLRGGRGAAAAALAGFAYEVARLAQKIRPGVIAAWSARAVLAVAAAPLPRGTRIAAVHHDLPPGPAIAAALRVANRRAATVIATSAAVARALPAENVVVLRPGVDLDAWRPRPPPPPDPPRALVLGALVRWKRADLALDIAARLPELRLTIAGAGAQDFTATLEARADEPDVRGRVEFAGALEDPREAIAASHVLLHCADVEPWGLVLLEALASARPVVAPAAGGPVEIVTPETGRLYPPGDADAGAAALREVLKAREALDPRRRAEAFPVEASAARFAEAIG
jgi:glycosyltransferase involved in cell wall biosynthesis